MNLETTLKSNHQAALNEINIYIPGENKIEQKISCDGPEIIRNKITMAKQAQQKWAKLSLKQRSKELKKVIVHIEKNAQAYASIISHYNGKPFFEALMAEIFPTLNCFQYFSGRVRKVLHPENIFIHALPLSKAQIHYKPLGIVGIIAPWNYPFKIALQDVPAALMAGNAVVIKMSEYSAGIGQLIEKIFQEVEFPPHLVQCIYGYGSAGAQLIEEELVQKICFIGSYKTGTKVASLAGEKLIPCTLELGGKDAAIVLEDCNIKKTTAGVVWGGFCNNGQTCASIEMLYVPEKMKELFLKELKNYFESLEECNFGHMNTQFQNKIVWEQLQEAIKKGAKVLSIHSKAKTADSTNNPFAPRPTIIYDLPEGIDLSLERDETFGPILPIYFYRNLENVVQKINQSPFGLTTSIWTENLRKGEELASKIDSGVVTINDHMITPGLPEVPWLGHKKSGLGISGSKEALIDFSQKKVIYYDRGPFNYKLWQFPYHSSKINLALDFIKAQFSLNLFKKMYYAIKSFPQLLGK